MKKVLIVLISFLLFGCNVVIDNKSNIETNEIVLGNKDINIINGGTYTLTGTLDNASIIIEVNKDEEVNLILDNVTINSNDYAAIYIKEARQVTITLDDDSKNVINDGNTYTQIDDENVDAVIYSKADLVFEGSGTLVINANYKHGIVSKDSLIINSGTYNIDSLNNCLYGKDSIEIYGGSYLLESGTDTIVSDNEEESLGYIYLENAIMNIKSNDDGIKAINYITINSGSYNIESLGKGLIASSSINIKGGDLNINGQDDALHSEKDILIEAGNLTIYTKDDGLHADGEITINDGNIEIIESHEGLEGAEILIEGGDIIINSLEDGINAADGSGSGNYDISSTNTFASLIINGGNLYINASGDGIDSNANLQINGGNTFIEGPTSDMNASIDYEGEGSINGGELIVIGSSAMAMSFSNTSKQTSFLYIFDKVYDSSNIEIYVNDELLSEFKTTKQFSALNYSSENLNVKDNVRINIDDDSYTFEINDISYSNK